MHGRTFPPIRIIHPHVVEHPSLGMLVSGTRVPVRRLYRWQQRGVSVATLIARYPSLKSAAILDALSFAYDNADRIEAELAYEQEILGTDVGRLVDARTSDRSDARPLPTFFAWL